MAIVVHKEHVLTVVAALRDMMCKSDRYCSGQSWHDDKVATKAAPVKKKIGGCPYFISAAVVAGLAAGILGIGPPEGARAGGQGV